MWIEPEGYFSASQIWTQYPKLKKHYSSSFFGKGAREAKALISNPSGFRTSKSSIPYDFPKRNTETPVFLLLMDNVSYTGWHPRGLLGQQDNYPLYTTPDKAISHIYTIVKKLGGHLIIKRHPACCVYTNIKPSNIPSDIEYYDGPVDPALKAADVILTFLSKTAFPALAMGKPVVTLAQNPVAASGSTYHPSTIHDVEIALRNARDKKDLKEKLEKFIPFLGWAAEEYYYSYTSTPPIFPDLTKTCNICGSNRGPKQLVDNIIDIESPDVYFSQQYTSTTVAFLRYVAGCQNNAERPSLDPNLNSRIRLIGQCAARVAIYGAGKFAKRLLSEAGTEMEHIKNHSSLTVFDDNPTDTDFSWSQVHKTEELCKFMAMPGCVVIMATDTWQKSMRDKLHKLGIDDSKIINLFE